MRVGEFDTYKPSHRKQNVIRYLFLEAIQTSKPQIIQSLFDNVFTPFKSQLPIFSRKVQELEDYARENLVQEWIRKNPEREAELTEFFEEIVICREFDPRWQENLYWRIYEVANEQCHPELIPIREAIVQWSIDNNLNSNWFKSVTMWTLNGWRTEMPIEREMEWFWQMGAFKFEINKAEEMRLLPSPDFPLWQPFAKRKALYMETLEKSVREIYATHPILNFLPKGNVKACVDALKNVAKNYCARVEKYYKENGYEHYRKNPLSRKQKRNIKWTVQVYVANRPEEAKKKIDEIVEYEKVQEKTVKESIKAMLKTLGLPLEPIFHSEPGRPPNSKDSPTSERQRLSLY